MASASIAGTVKKSQPYQTIFLAGLLCGCLDITATFIAWSLQGISPYRILQAIASGLLGIKSFRDGMASAALGAAFHLLIAFSAAGVFYAASRKFRFMVRHAILSGALYGVAVYLFMYWLVMPLSRIAPRPFSLSETIIAIITHVVCVGLPIALVVRRYSS